MPNKFCESCGSLIAEGAKFCNACGATIQISNNPPPPPVVMPSQQTNNTQNIPPSNSQMYNEVQRQQSSINSVAQQYSIPAQQQYYQQYNSYQNLQKNEPMTIGQYLLTMIVSAIPIVGFIMLLVWAFSAETNINKKNFCRAVLILSIISAVLCFLFAAVIMSFIASIINSSSGGYNGY